MNILNGWKEIATHLHQGVRTVQRWELMGLPIHRVGATSRSPVIAFSEELDEWGKGAAMRLLDELGELKKQMECLEAEVRSLKATTEDGNCQNGAARKSN